MSRTARALLCCIGLRHTEDLDSTLRWIAERLISGEY